MTTSLDLAIDECLTLPVRSIATRKRLARMSLENVELTLHELGDDEVEVWWHDDDPVDGAEFYEFVGKIRGKLGLILNELRDSRAGYPRCIVLKVTGKRENTKAQVRVWFEPFSQATEGGC